MYLYKGYSALCKFPAGTEDKKQAAQEEKLFREQPFVLSVDAGQLNEQ